MSYFIASTEETDDNSYPLFWSQEGWTDIKFATKYTEDESKLYSLPFTGVWCTSDDVRYLADDKRGQS